MKPTIKLLLSLGLLFLGSVFIFQSCDDPDDEKYDKPNIYIYPNETIELTVKINFPLGGNIDTSIPKYETGWNILVDTSGLIDNTYSYLFYESTQPSNSQEKNGWVIQQDKLGAFFTQNMTDYGFNSQEIKDFIDYWIPRLKDAPYYSIYPQTNDIINKVVELEFSKQPDNILRLIYLIKAQHQLDNTLTEPTIKPFKREGYFVTEWGVSLR